MELYPHQLKALESMKNGCILNGGTGTGKSLTAIAYYYLVNGGDRASLTSNNYIPLTKTPKDLYIITTARKRDTHDWDKELGHFHIELYSNNVTVDSWNNIEKYRAVFGAFFIFDEQRVVGSGKWARSFIKIAKQNEWILLSATPGDKWEDYMAVFIANGYYRNKTDFVDQHMIMDYRAGWPRVAGYLDIPRLKHYRDNLLVDMKMSRSTEQHHKVIRTDYNKSLYSLIYKDRKDPSRQGYVLTNENEPGTLVVGIDISPEDVEPKMPGWDFEVHNGDKVRFDYAPIESASEYCHLLRKTVNMDPSKVESVRSIIQEHNKVIIFYKYNYELDILHESFDDSEFVITEWNGHKHESIPTSNKWIYLVQYTAGCEGWNCIETDTIIFFSLDYSYKVMIQSCGRIDRLNTPFKDLYYYHLLSKSSIDGAIVRALKGKKNFNEGIFFTRQFR